MAASICCRTNNATLRSYHRSSLWAILRSASTLCRKLSASTSQSNVLNPGHAEGWVRLPNGRLADAFSVVQQNAPASFTQTWGPFEPEATATNDGISVPRWPGLALCALEDRLLPGAHFLDVGCGTGYVTAIATLLVTDGGVVGRGTAVDRDSTVIEQAVPNIVDALGLRNKPDSSLLRGLVLTPADGTADWNAAAPYEAIHVGFALPSLDSDAAQTLLSQLRPGGKMVAPVGGVAPGEQRLLCVTRPKERGAGHSVIALDASDTHTPVELMEHGVLLEKESDAEEEARLKREGEREEILAKLQKWKDAFFDKHGRKPNRTDLAADREASGLFARFSQLS